MEDSSKKRGPKKAAAKGSKAKKRLIIRDFSNWAPRDAAIPAEGDAASCADCAAVILAYEPSCSPLIVAPDDPGAQPFTCESTEKHPVARPLQTYDGLTMVARSVSVAREAGCAKVTVIGPANPKLFAKVKREAKKAGADACVPFDVDALEAARVESGNYELYGLSRYLLDFGAACDTPLVFFIDCQQARITSRHLQQLRYRFSTAGQIKAVTSWSVWLRRMPYLLSHELLAQAAPKLAADEVSEVVFGEEKLAANGAPQPAFDGFFATCKISALQAVRIARQLAQLDAQAGSGDAADVEKQRQALLGTLSESDKLFVELAQQTINDLGSASADDAADLAWADAWAKRNRLDFPIFTDRKQRDTLVFLDSAATTQRPQQTEDALLNFDIHENANVYRGGYDLSMQATFTLNDVRKVLEDFIGANRRETVYTQNATGGANLIAQAWGQNNIGAGDLIVTTVSDHHSNILPWVMLAEQKGARIGYVPISPDGTLDQQTYKELLKMKPKLVCLSHISNVMGIVNPIEKMARAAHKAGARVFCDGAQSLPHMRINVYDLGVDFFAFSGHKMYGPMGIGGVWIHPDAYKEMMPVTSGGGAISHMGLDSYYLRLGAIAYELGTPAVSQAVGLAAAASFLEGIGMDNVARHSAVLTRYLTRGLSAIDGITVLGDHGSGTGLTGLVSFTFFGLLPAQTGRYLGKTGVAVRSGGHCAIPLSANLGIIGSTRISLGIYNTKEDIEAACTALRLCRTLLTRTMEGMR